MRHKRLARGGGRLEHALRERLRVAEQAGRFVAQGRDDRARQGRQVDHRVDRSGLVESHGVGEGIGQHQTAFGVGVDDFDGRAVHPAQHVARPVGAARRQVFGARQNRGDRQRQSQLGRADGNRGRGGRAGFVVDHVAHALGWLDADAAGVERDALADDRHVLLRVWWRVAQDAEGRRPGRAGADGQDESRLQALERFGVQDLGRRDQRFDPPRPPPRQAAWVTGDWRAYRPARAPGPRRWRERWRARAPARRRCTSFAPRTAWVGDSHRPWASTSSAASARVRPAGALGDRFQCRLRMHTSPANDGEAGCSAMRDAARWRTRPRGRPRGAAYRR